MTISFSNSPTNVFQIIERRFNTVDWPSLLKLLLQMMRKERKPCVAVAAIEVSVDEYFAENNISELPSERVPNVRHFENFLFSTSRNGHMKDQEAVVSGCVPGQVSANPKTLKVLIYMGDGWKIDYPTLDKRSPPDLFVKLQMHRLSTGKGKTTVKKTTVKKTTVQRNNWTPCWGEEFEFPLYSPSENASLFVEVYDFDRIANDFAGKNTLLVSQLRPGIRAVSLFDKMGNQYSVTRLLIHFMFV